MPEAPGVNCALGLLMADFRHDYSQTLFMRLNDLDPQRLNGGFAQLEGSATEQMVREGLAVEDLVLHRSGDLRYVGQGYELQVPLRGGDSTIGDLGDIAEQFSRMHEDNFGYRMPNDAVEVVNLRLTAIGVTAKPQLREEPLAGEDASQALGGTRRMYMEGAYREVAVYDRTGLRCGNRLDSPAVVEQLDSTTVVFPGCEATVDRYRNLIVTQVE